MNGDVPFATRTKQKRLKTRLAASHDLTNIIASWLDASGTNLHATVMRQTTDSDQSNQTKLNQHTTDKGLQAYVPLQARQLDNPQTAIPRIAKDSDLMAEIERAVQQIPTTHSLYRQDSRNLSLKRESVHLVLTSPPYWTLKEYNLHDDQLGYVQDYEKFLKELDMVWRRCFKALVPGGRLICVVGDVCLSRRKNAGVHTVVPLHASIQEHCRRIGYTNLAPIIWHKIANANYEVENGSTFLGKPYEPNSVIKNDVEFILMERKGGGYRRPSIDERVLSIISAENHSSWFQQIWSGITGASTRQHPAPFPLQLAERLIRMFSFVGDTVLDPFVGSGTTSLAAANWGRNSIGFEVDPEYHEMATQRLHNASAGLFKNTTIRTECK